MIWPSRHRSSWFDHCKGNAIRWRGTMSVLLLCIATSGCSGVGETLKSFKGPDWPFDPPAQSAAWSEPEPGPYLQSVAHTQMQLGPPRIVKPKRRIQCVPYARELSKIQIRGNARTWWKQAEGHYRRSRRPAVGSVLVLKHKGGSRGHLAVVTQIISDREIIANHANWLNRGRVHLNTPVRDVSPNNDWSAVRVWYTPGNVLGKSVYPAYGFIYPATTTASR